MISLHGVFKVLPKLRSGEEITLLSSKVISINLE